MVQREDFRLDSEGIPLSATLFVPSRPGPVSGPCGLPRDARGASPGSRRAGCGRGWPGLPRPGRVVRVGRLCDPDIQLPRHGGERRELSHTGVGARPGRRGFLDTGQAGGGSRPRRAAGFQPGGGCRHLRHGPPPRGGRPGLLCRAVGHGPAVAAGRGRGTSASNGPHPRCGLSAVPGGVGQ